MTPPPSILIATTNAGKVREVRAVLAGLPVSLSSLTDHGSLPEAVEDADTFEGNAHLKALHYARLTGGWALADDSGLEVDALDGAPGVYSARFAGPQCDDRDNCVALLERLAGIPDEKRTARFRCVLAVAHAGKVLTTTAGTLEGRILTEPRGQNGFGYDPLFFVPSEAMTAAEMNAAQKNRISHRGQALRAMRPKIEQLLLGRHRNTSD